LEFFEDNGIWMHLHDDGDYVLCTETGFEILEARNTQAQCIRIASLRWICYFYNQENNAAIHLSLQNHFSRVRCPWHRNDMQANFCSLTSENEKSKKVKRLTVA
jgi:hypothetical protein